MFSKRTVIVLGAGASMPYGFPLGPELVRKILDLRSNLKEFANRYIVNKWRVYKQTDVDPFLDALHLSDEGSIDAFLMNRPVYREIGKLAVALVLCADENQYANQHKHFDLRTDLWKAQDWYQLLSRNFLGRTAEHIKKNKLVFVTFNYDRSLEHYLYTTIMNRFGKDESEAADVMKCIPIYHVHGRLGMLEWQKWTMGRQNSAASMTPAMKQLRWLRSL